MRIYKSIILYKDQVKGPIYFLSLEQNYWPNSVLNRYNKTTHYTSYSLRTKRHQKCKEGQLKNFRSFLMIEGEISTRLFLSVPRLKTTLPCLSFSSVYSTYHFIRGSRELVLRVISWSRCYIHEYLPCNLSRRVKRS